MNAAVEEAKQLMNDEYNVHMYVSGERVEIG